MPFLVAKSIPMSLVTRDAIRHAGGVFLRRGRSPEHITRVMSSGRYEFLWNMGNSEIGLPHDFNMYNPPGLVRTLTSYQLMRVCYDEFMPPRTGETEYIWEKRHGRAGQGKTRHKTSEVDLDTLSYWEDEVLGTEFRLITVDGAVVQQFIREGENGNRSYRWVAQVETPRALKEQVREAASMWVPTVKSVIAWDTVITPDGRPFIYEGNTSPGLSVNTANRIVNYIRSRGETE